MKAIEYKEHCSDAIIKKFLDKIATVKNEIRDIYLFGSRCRDDWRPDSDYDIMLVVEEKKRDLASLFYDAVMDILLDTGRLISLKIFTAAEFDRLKSIPTPFMQNVLNEGVRLGTDD